ncbi:MAG: hypothetical protein K5771_07945 [Oscillospiraceae bacterium]|nr:hypothetical protein [Oscillospiraceae bacterium]
MNEQLVNIICTVISSFCVLLGVLLSNRNSTDKMQSEMRTAQAVTDTKIEELTREVREHNNFAKRVPVLEEQIRELQRKGEQKICH